MCNVRLIIFFMLSSLSNLEFDKDKSSSSWSKATAAFVFVHRSLQEFYSALIFIISSKMHFFHKKWNWQKFLSISLFCLFQCTFDITRAPMEYQKNSDEHRICHSGAHQTDFMTSYFFYIWIVIFWGTVPLKRRILWNIIKVLSTMKVKLWQNTCPRPFSFGQNCLRWWANNMFFPQ